MAVKTDFPASCQERSEGRDLPGRIRFHVRPRGDHAVAVSAPSFRGDHGGGSHRRGDVWTLSGGTLDERAHDHGGYARFHSDRAHDHVLREQGGAQAAGGNLHGRRQ